MGWLFLLACAGSPPPAGASDDTGTEAGEATDTAAPTGPVPVDTSPDATSDSGEPTDSGGDVDGDGYSADDCDDDDASVYPGAEDPACDGIDQDCSGDDDRDQDRDGWWDPACGGTDCDPAHPWVHPGAQELCDGIDHDCDGDTLDEDTCSEVQQHLGLARPTVRIDALDGHGSADVLGISGDLDGDGLPDVVLSCGDSNGACLGADGTADDGTFLLTGVEGTWNVAHHQAATDQVDWRVTGAAVGSGDQDGDGIDDLFVRASSTWAGVLPGPFSEWSSAKSAEAAAAVSIEGNSGMGWWVEQAAAGDLDGDGLAELIVGFQVNTCAHHGSDPDGFRVWPGGESGAISVARLSVVDSYDTSYGFGDQFLVVGDVDGDGFSELLVTDTGRGVYLFSGPEVVGLGSDEAELTDVVAGTYTGNPSCVAAPGDWDGDGLADWVAGTSGADEGATGAGALRFLSGAPLADGVLADAPGSLFGDQEGAGLGASCTAADVDGDGEREIVAYRAIDEDPGWLIVDAPGSLPAGAWEPEAVILMRSADTDLLSDRDAPHVGDLDGDGDDELLWRDYADRVEGELGGYAVVLGWDLPWPGATLPLR